MIKLTGSKKDEWHAYIAQYIVERESEIAQRLIQYLFDNFLETGLSATSDTDLQKQSTMMLVLALKNSDILELKSKYHGSLKVAHLKSWKKPEKEVEETVQELMETCLKNK